MSEARGDVRRAVPRSAHAEFSPAADRDPIALLQRQATEREPMLVPLRHQRMSITPFTYFRGAALPMAWDLARTPTTGLTVQLCGDAHLSNFGMFGSPERHLYFDVNDFDETLPGPFEWDVKRLAASLEIAARERGFSAKQRRGAVLGAVRSYRDAMAGFTQLSSLDVWYAHLDVDRLIPEFLRALDRVRTPAVWKAISTARAHDSMQAFARLTEVVDGQPRIVHDPPIVVPLRELVDAQQEEIHTSLESMVFAYRQTLQWDRRHLLSRYRLVDVAHKVVGVGSVGTRCWIALLLDLDSGSPLFLQVKEAQASVLEGFLPKSTFRNHGHRVVAGQRLMQATSDLFLGWERQEYGSDRRDSYVRQLRDWKGSAEVANMTPAGMLLYARMCGWTLARAHARSGDRVAIAAYLGTRDVFDRAIADFAIAYADRNEVDHRELLRAMEDGRLAS
ncbi:MAG TPA: DUF2252 domain-containing protein [Actinomycetota bacterium]|nr:DUF2252 domain-containing protein [Actinomycetota bacterium]